MKLIIILTTVLAAVSPVFSYGRNCNDGCYLADSVSQCRSNEGCQFDPCNDSANGVCFNVNLNENYEQCRYGCEAHYGPPHGHP